MKKKTLLTLLAVLTVAIGSLTACNTDKNPSSEEKVTAESSSEVESTNAEETKVEETQQKSDQELADEVAALIDAIYVQQRTDQTDEQCAAAKAAWDKLTDEQKELVEGEFADPDYFGLDTGDASKDDPLNQDGIGEKELLVVSFGTSYNNSRVEDISSVEKALAQANPDWSVRRAFTAQIIINHVQARDGEKIDNMEQAMERAVKNGVKTLVVQPTHLMHGAEYDELCEVLEKYQGKIENIVVAEPLLGQVGKDADAINDDKQAVAKAVVGQAMKTAGYADAKAAAEDGVALVLMGHGTAHSAKVTYSQMQTQMNTLGYENVFVGTVEGEPEETACEEVIEAVAVAGYKKVILRPLMVVAGDHANNDMAGDDEDSWKSMFTASGKFDAIDVQIAGLGSIPEIQALYKAHTEAAMENLGSLAGNEEGNFLAAADLKEGVSYQAKFDTDSSMFGLNEVCGGKGVLTVVGGKLYIHVTLKSKSVLNLFPGLAADAQKEGAAILQPTLDVVTYDDGTKEEVYGFDVPVPYLDKEFDLALVGTKGTWYDHKVSVSQVTEGAANASVVVGSQAPALEEQTEASTSSNTTKITLNGGSGKATIESPAQVIKKDGKDYAVLIWNSKNYDYMIVDGVKYLNEAKEGENSKFTIPIKAYGEEISVIGDTIAMSAPHEIEYTIIFELVQ
ncbi:MAG: sirohydrochlorin cobaltochelatase [Lachnospiraceae bacterium]|nr:sirohydrochlorin cobaltochelatase [Lachnospiraceae bacterium]